MSMVRVVPVPPNGRTEAAGTPAAAARDMARAASRRWAARALPERAAVLESAAGLMTGEADTLASAIAAASRRTAVEVWSGEIVPTVDALRWLARDGVHALRGCSGTSAPPGTS
jgi:acyl-CoA reductase-like NAD-dependent aldehyde dehydrogenase